MKNGASDRLYNYRESEQELPFRQLMYLYGRMIDEELRFTEGDDEDVKRDFPRYATEMREAKQKALEIYSRHVQDAAKEMQASDSGFLRTIGMALETGEWSEVCI